MKENPIKKGRWIIDKIGMFPYNLVKNHKNKNIRKVCYLLLLIWMPIVLTPFIPYFFYNMVEVILHDC
jgi:hypothetical protein|tara:strand:+ start:808 stop:1011 length:204 start_codon:yes stop_codon:yes gene_type:complete